MKRWSIVTSVSVGALSLALAGPLAAQTGQDYGQDRQYDTPTQPGVGVAPDMDREQLADAIRGSELMDMEVTNYQDESLGTISDILISHQDGSVSHVVLSRNGGVLGIGENGDQYLVPWDQVEFSPDMQSAQLDVQEDQIDAEFAVFDEEMLERERDLGVDEQPDTRFDQPPANGTQQPGMGTQ